MSAFAITIRSNGVAMDRPCQVLALDIVKEVDRLPDATLILLEQHTPEGQFPLSDADFFAPGRPLEITANWIGEAATVLFAGRVVRHAVRFGDGGLSVRVELRDAAVGLTRPRRSRTFTDKTDAQVFSDLAEQAGLRTGQVADTRTTYPLLLQYRSNDWDFLVTRAQAFGLCVVADDGELSLREPSLEGSADLRLTLGIDEIYDLELEADALDQEAGIAASAWDPAQQQATDPVSATDFDLAQGDPQPARVAQDLGFAASELGHRVPLEAAEVQGWVDGLLRRNRLAMLRGRISLKGRPGVKPLQRVELGRVGSRFAGTALIGGIRHRFDDQGWRTDLTLGLAAARHARRPDLAQLPAAGLLPPVSGLQIGVIGQPPDESDDEQRVPVVLPVLDQHPEPIMARLATPHAGADHGFVFRPEPNDEVVVGFLNGDPRQPVVLGALFSSKQPPPGDYAQADRDNGPKGLVTRSGTRLGFVDGDKPRLFLETPAGRRVLLDDDDASITIEDPHGNRVLMNSDGVHIKSGSDLTLEASGAVKIKGQSIDLE